MRTYLQLLGDLVCVAVFWMKECININQLVYTINFVTFTWSVVSIVLCEKNMWTFKKKHEIYPEVIKLISFFSSSKQNSDGPSRYDFLTWDIQDMPTEPNLFGLFVYNVFWQGPIEKIAVKLDLLLLVYLSIDCLEMDVIMLLMGLLSYTKNAGCACAGNAGDVFPRHRLQRKPLVSDPGIHHHVPDARAVLHVGIANPRWRGKRSRHSRRMRNPQVYVSGKSPNR